MAFFAVRDVHWPNRTYELPLFPLDLWTGEGMARLQSLARLCVTGSIGRLAGVVNEILCEEFVTGPVLQRAVFSSVRGSGLP